MLVRVVVIQMLYDISHLLVQLINNTWRKDHWL